VRELLAQRSRRGSALRDEIFFPTRKKNRRRLTLDVLQVLLFDRSVGVGEQLNVVEIFGILIMRTRDGNVFVFRLSDLDELLETDEPAFAINDLNLPNWQPKYGYKNTLME